jgi:tRNA pseudouridine55 synthase
MKHGILPVYKPKGYTSHDVVKIIRRLIGQKRVGHTGTLDPEVVGVLPICIGMATRVVEYIQELPKRYKGSLLLGISTDTQDQTGKIIEQVPVGKIDRKMVEEVFQQFVGIIEQIPPMYSAIKVKGRRLYDLARNGEVATRRVRKVKIYELTCLSVEMDNKNPQIHFDVLCSKGTYIRTLCLDIGKALGYPAHMNNLIRTKSGPFYLEDCFTLQVLQEMAREGKMKDGLTRIDEALGQFPCLIISDEEISGVLNGFPLKIEPEFSFSSPFLFRVYSESGRFCAIYGWDEELNLAKPKKVFRDVEN